MSAGETADTELRSAPSAGRGLGTAVHDGPPVQCSISASPLLKSPPTIHTSHGPATATDRRPCFPPWPPGPGGCVPSHAGHPAVAEAIPEPTRLSPAARPTAATAPPSLVIGLMRALLTCFTPRTGSAGTLSRRPEIALKRH